jgi:malate dehydrogenase (oxaloacetate-decarboxylating)
MKMAAAEAIAAAVRPSELTEEYIVPSVFDRGMFRDVAKAVSRAAESSGVARRKRARHRRVVI